MSVNKLFLAAAGCGKTTYIINEALKLKNQNILITTYTDNNEISIKKKILEINGTIPKNIKIQTWFSFLINHGVKPYITCFFSDVNDVTGLDFVQYYDKKHPAFNTNKYKKEHYFTKTNKIYSISLSEFIIECNTISKNKIINRLENIFDTIFIDEVQDISGQDLNLIELLFNSYINIYMVGDLRQRVYMTNTRRKNFRKENDSYVSSNIYDFIKNKCINNCQIDTVTLNKSYRNNKEICYFASQLYPSYDIVQSCSIHSDEHEGIYSIKTKEVDKYLELYPNNIIQLRNRKSSANKIINIKYPVMNFGAVKGLEYDRVMIFTTKEIINFLKKEKLNKYSEYKAKLYVAITRARYSVVFVTDEDLTEYGIKKFSFD